MPRLTDSIPLKDPFLKRNVKLLPCQREMIPKMYDRGASQRQLARHFQVSRRLITFVLDPAKLEHSNQLRKERGGSKIYYHRKKHSKAIKDHRNYKKDLFRDMISENTPWKV